MRKMNTLGIMLRQVDQRINTNGLGFGEAMTALFVMYPDISIEETNYLRPLIKQAVRDMEKQIFNRSL